MSRNRYTYAVAYMETVNSEEKIIDVIAGNKREAYRKVVDELNPYGACVISVTYANGNSKRFNTCIGDPF